MKDLRMLVWLTQTGLNVCMPLTVCTLLAFWLRQRFELGIWVILAGLALGLAGAANGLYRSLQKADRMARDSGDKHKWRYP